MTEEKRDEITIPERYVAIKHYILDETCPVCGKKFKVGDRVEMVPIQKSRSGQLFTSEAIIVHTDCHYVE